MLIQHRLRKVVVLCAALALAAVWLAGAVPVGAVDPATAEATATGSLLVTVQLDGYVVPDALTLFDQDWQQLSEVRPDSAGHTFHGLEAGDYHVMAYLDAMMIGSKGKVTVQPGKTAHQTLSTQYQYSAGTKSNWSGTTYECVSASDGGQKINAYCLGPVIGFGYWLGQPKHTYITYARVCGPTMGGAKHPPAYITGCAKMPVIACIPGHCK